MRRLVGRIKAYPLALRFLIVDDNERFVQAARELLEGDQLEVAGVATNGSEAVALVTELEPDVALVDIDLGDEDGFTVARQLSGARIILISTYAESDFADLIAESPAIGFISKSDLSRRAIDELLRAAA